MKHFLMPWFRVVVTIFKNPLVVVGGLVLCLSPIAARGQSVSFAGAQSVLPASFQPTNPSNVAVDSVGDVFIADSQNSRVVELPRTATGYGPQITLPFTGLTGTFGAAVDMAGDVFITVLLSSNSVLELPKTPTGYGPQMTLPFKELEEPIGIAVDSTGDLFVAEFGHNRVVELPKTQTGYGRQVTLPASGLVFTEQVAVDGAGDVFLTNNNQVVELPKTATGYGPQTSLPTVSQAELLGLAVDNAGDVFIDGLLFDDTLGVVELAKTATGYGPQITLPFNAVEAAAVAVDGAGSVFVIDNSDQSVVELQTVAVDFGGANVCAPGAATPAPCSQTLTLTYNVNADTTLGKPEVLTGGMTHLDFTRADGSTCTGAVSAGTTCTVNVTFSPLAAGFRHGSVDVTDGSGKFIATTQVSGFGIAATTGVPVAQISTSYMPFGTIPFGTSKTLPVMIANIGGGTLTVTPSISGHSYKIAQSNCAAGVTPGTSCTLVVEFDPTSVSPNHDDVLTVKTNGGEPAILLAGGASAQ